ncbi:MAG: RbsD or FucU transport [Burkholderiales bacterium]|nr:RbsD or FucU transport [Burkholderiales bacterium]
MLKGINPILSPDLIKVLMEMGHDDAIVLVDANFTAQRLAKDKPVLRLPGISMVQAVRAVVSVLPLVADADHPVGFMQVSGSPEGYLSALQREVLALVEPSFLTGQRAEAIERFAFYERTRQAFAIVVTGEMQPFGNFLLRKGVIGENLRP